MGIYTTSISSGSMMLGTETLVQTAISGTNVVITSEEAFEGYIILI